MLPIRRCRAPASAGGGEQRGRGERFAEPRPENRAGDAEIGQASDRYRSQIGQISVTNRTDIGRLATARGFRIRTSAALGARFPNPPRVGFPTRHVELRCSLPARRDARSRRGAMLAPGGARCWLGRAGTGVLHAERAWPGRGDRGAGGVRRRGNPAPRRHEEPDPARQGEGLGHGSSGARCSWGGRLADVSMRTPHEACRAPGTGVSGHGLE
jgi:hypothetical protein